MFYEPLQTRLVGFMTEADHFCGRLQAARNDALGTPSALAAELELIRFYGQAFAQVVRLLSEAEAVVAGQAAALEQAILGRTVSWEWQRRTTSLVSPLELHAMQARWEALCAFVQDWA